MAQKNIMERIGAETHLVVNRSALSAGALAGILREGSWEPEGGEICELVAGGQVVACGRIVKRRGSWHFKALEVAKGGSV